MRLQLSRWTWQGKFTSYGVVFIHWRHLTRKSLAHPFIIANKMLHASYVSCQSALAFYGLIPEYVPVTVSVTTTRPGRKETFLGVFEFHHIKPELFHGYRLIELETVCRLSLPHQKKLYSTWLTCIQGSISPAYIQELRLQNRVLNLDELNHQAERFNSSSC